MLKTWQKRSPEEANLFNPAFISSLIYEFSKEFKKQKKAAVPIIFVPVMLAAILHEKTRKRLPHSTITSLYQWLQENEDLKIGFSDRCIGILPYSKESIRFGMCRSTLVFDNGYGIDTGEVKAHFPASFIKNTTAETKEIIDRSKFMARWLAKSGSEASIMGAWGVKP